MDLGDDSGSEAGEGESDDMLENPLQNPQLGDEEDEDDDEEDEDEMMGNPIRRSHLGDDSEMMENLIRRSHFGEHGDLIGNYDGRQQRQYHVEDDADLMGNFDGRVRFDEDGDAIGNSGGRAPGSSEDGEDQEPFQGMQFESEEAAKKFYNSYARRVGFSIRVSIYCRSKRDGSIISRRFVCSKEGFRRKKSGGSESKSKRPRAITREGCKAMILVKKQSSGVWVLSKFQKEHNHPLAPPGKVHCLRSHRGDKDKTIRELTHELERVNQKCAAYRSRLLMVLKDVEEHLTKKVEDVRQSIRDIESEEQDH
ncbi:hypothetical protein MRB53_000887 [Persea americana]|uniref:Uncharacterized protein n=1 Tax=Persea americana TaxID=3435 RepID=A0ACC2MR60_PERAE|nr:hypothetical protein MRB53_000887 [Persea americana]|eukprot:TRINITY_DN1625_c0_g1_i1.p1 TRINITY_DN1625_c0_g1~~TRINITY_DN1625_c0_g1_i1.p1  ORF type:complete len:310 (-),score=70.99 TRINITY_DN1625_c0_g1_i1:376-1305(-)